MIPDWAKFHEAFLYHGMVLTDDYSTLLLNFDTKKLTKIDLNTSVYHPCGKFVQVYAGLDPFLEDHEHRQGFVDLDEIMCKLRGFPDKWDLWTSTTDEEIASYEKNVTEQGRDTSKIQIGILETTVDERILCFSPPGSVQKKRQVKSNLPCLNRTATLRGNEINIG